MGVKHPLHRKKLQLALKALSAKVVEKSSELDHIWVTSKRCLMSMKRQNTHAWNNMVENWNSVTQSFCLLIQSAHILWSFATPL